MSARVLNVALQDAVDAVCWAAAVTLKDSPTEEPKMGAGQGATNVR